MKVKITRNQLLRALRGYTVQVATSVGLLEIEAEADPEWVPMKQIPMTPTLIEMHRLIGMDPANMEVWTNGTYEAFVKPLDEEAEAEASRNGVVHLSVKRMDRMVIHDWRHLQQIKNEVMGEFREAVELYPGEHRVADSANQYHLWVAPAGEELPFGFPDGYVTDDDEAAAFNKAEERKPFNHRGFQEPRQQGITVGDGMIDATDPAAKAQAQAILESLR